MPYLSASALVIHYEEALYQVYVVYLYLYASWFQPMVLVSFSLLYHSCTSSQACCRCLLCHML